MSSNGFYVTVEANEVMPMEADPSNPGTGGTIRYWVNWTTTAITPGDTGFSGVSWYPEDSNGPNWASYGVETPVTNMTIDEWVIGQGNNLEHVLGDDVWLNKNDFMEQHQSDLAGCITIIW